jgi:hypothetical protein
VHPPVNIVFEDFDGFRVGDCIVVHGLPELSLGEKSWVYSVRAVAIDRVESQSHHCHNNISDNLASRIKQTIDTFNQPSPNTIHIQTTRSIRDLLKTIVERVCKENDCFLLLNSPQECKSVYKERYRMVEGGRLEFACRPTVQPKMLALLASTGNYAKLQILVEEYRSHFLPCIVFTDIDDGADVDGGDYVVKIYGDGEHELVDMMLHSGRLQYFSVHDSTLTRLPLSPCQSDRQAKI